MHGKLFWSVAGIFVLKLGAAAQPNPISTAASFLMITPDSRAGGMGDAGVATSPDANSMHWNPAKYAFLESKGGLSLGVTPWLKWLAGDINLLYLAGCHRIDKKQVLAGSLKFFSWGKFPVTDERGHDLQEYTPSEFSLDAAYSRKLSDRLSMAMALRYIHSFVGVGGGLAAGNENPGNAFGVDVAVYGKLNRFSYGINVSNIGPRMQYGTHSMYLPMNLRLGGAFDFYAEDEHKFTFALDLNKFLVPTDQPVRDEEGKIIRMRTPDHSIPEAMFLSFTKAPGGFREKLREVSISTGTEYWYDDLLSLRTGFFYSHPTKESQQYFTAGAGIKQAGFNLDLAYLLPVQRQNPIEKALRVTLLYNFGGS